LNHHQVRQSWTISRNSPWMLPRRKRSRSRSRLSTISCSDRESPGDTRSPRQAGSSRSSWSTGTAPAPTGTPNWLLPGHWKKPRNTGGWGSRWISISTRPPPPARSWSSTSSGTSSARRTTMVARSPPFFHQGGSPRLHDTGGTVGNSRKII